MRKLTIVNVALVFILSGCTTVKVPAATGGSRSDGVVELSYEYGAFEAPDVLWEIANISARERCGAWGYHDARAFGSSKRKCNQYDQFGSCISTVDTIPCQCTDRHRQRHY